MKRFNYWPSLCRHMCVQYKVGYIVKCSVYLVSSLDKNVVSDYSQVQIPFQILQRIPEHI